MTESPTELLDAWAALLGAPVEKVAAERGLAESAARPGVNYGRLSGVTLLYDDDADPGQYYFRDGRLALIYIESPADTYPALSPQALAAALGEPAEALPSRAGRQRKQYVYPDRGVAYAADDDEVAFIEVFAPTTLEGYRSELYMAPKKFIR